VIEPQKSHREVFVAEISSEGFIDWTASDCPALDTHGQLTERSRIYLGSDSVMLPHLTEKGKRILHDRTKAKRPIAWALDRPVLVWCLEVGGLLRLCPPASDPNQSGP
jgi:hypothetical protein